MNIEFFTVIIVAAILSGSLSMVVSGVLFGCLQLLHQMVFGAAAETHGVIYALSAMTFDVSCLLVVVLCSSVFDRGWRLIALSITIFASIANNLYGLGAWLGYGSVEQVNQNGEYIYMAVAFLLIGSRFSGGVIRGCRNFINRHGPTIRRLPRCAESDS